MRNTAFWPIQCKPNSFIKQYNSSIVVSADVKIVAMYI
jgi:hypothetical protein